MEKARLLIAQLEYEISVEEKKIINNPSYYSSEIVKLGEDIRLAVTILKKEIEEYVSLKDAKDKAARPSNKINFLRNIGY